MACEKEQPTDGASKADALRLRLWWGSGVTFAIGVLAVFLGVLPTLSRLAEGAKFARSDEEVAKTIVAGIAVVFLCGSGLLATWASDRKPR